jgi:hypothetical protein
VIACRFALSPTFLSPPSINATIEGVVRPPSAFGITTGSFPSITETQEFVVPKSIPIILLILFYLNFNNYFQIVSIAISIPKRNSIKETDKKGNNDLKIKKLTTKCHLFKTKI